MSVFPSIVYVLLYIESIALLVMLIMSWVVVAVPPLGQNPFFRILVSMTEPIIAPFRTLLPVIKGLDLFSFIFAYMMLRIMLGLVGTLSSVRLPLI